MGARVKETQAVVRLTSEKAKEFKALCALRGTSIQFVLERAIDAFIAQEKNEKPE